MKLQHGACAISDLFSLIRRQIRNISAYCLQIINQQLQALQWSKFRRTCQRSLMYTESVC